MILKLALSTASIAFACLAMTVPAQATTVYKTVGEFGEVKYSQFPPEAGMQAEVIQLRQNGRQMQTGNLAGSTGAKPEAQSETKPKSPTPSAESEKARSQAKNKNAKACAALRENLVNLNSGDRIHEEDGKGGRKYLDTREIELKRDDVEKALLQSCSS